jgi:hypothetical protein
MIATEMTIRNHKMKRPLCLQARDTDEYGMAKSRYHGMRQMISKPFGPK